MGYPKKISIAVLGTKYQIKVDLSKRDCRFKRAHCHVYDGTKKIAKVYFDTCLFAEVPNWISYTEQNLILNTVDKHNLELWLAYDNNAKYGTD